MSAPALGASRSRLARAGLSRLGLQLLKFQKFWKIGLTTASGQGGCNLDRPIPGHTGVAPMRPCTHKIGHVRLAPRSGGKADILGCAALCPIVLKKSNFASDRKFAEALVRSSRIYVGWTSSPTRF